MSYKNRVKEGHPWLFDCSVLVLKEVEDSIPRHRWTLPILSSRYKFIICPSSNWTVRWGIGLGLPWGWWRRWTSPEMGLGGDAAFGFGSTLTWQNHWIGVEPFILMGKSSGWLSSTRNCRNSAIHAVESIMRVPVAKATKGFGSMMRGQQNNEGFGYGQTTFGTRRVDHQRPVRYKQNPRRMLMLRQILARARG